MLELNCNDWTDEVNNVTFLTPFLKINEYNKNTQSNIFNICTQEVIWGCVNWMENHKTQFFDNEKIWTWACACTLKHRLYMPWTTS